MSDHGKLNLGYIKEDGKQLNDADKCHLDDTTKSKPSGLASNFTESKIEDIQLNPVMDVLRADIISTPFSIVAGSAKIPHSKFNPFRKKSGLLNVLSNQAKVL